MKFQKQPPSCTALSYSSCWATAETLGIGQWLGHESWLHDSFSAATGTWGDPFSKPSGRRRIGLTSMLCPFMSDGPLERGWLGDLLMHKLNKVKASPWGLAVHGAVLPLVKSQDEWVALLWLGNLPSNPVFTHLPWSLPCSFWSWFCFSWFRKNGASGLWIKGLRQGPLWLSCFNNSQQRMEMHPGVYRMGPGLAVEC